MRRRGATGRTLTTVLFTDIVGSTELASELGDQRWKQVLATHHGVVRKTLKRYGGREIDTAGDGFFATFARPAEAIRCASDIVDQLRQIGIHIRAGVHMGEVEQMGAKVGGIGVHIGSRVAAKAGASEILVSSTVRDLVAGSDIRFVDRGAHDLKGVPGEWHLYAIDHELAGEAPAKPIVDAPAATSARRRTVPAVGVGVAGLIVAALIVGTFALVSRNDTGSLKAPAPDTVSSLDARSGRIGRVVRVGTRPTGVATGGGSIWVINAADQTLSRVDPSGKSSFSAIAVGGSPSGIAFGSGSVWITTEFGLASGAPGSVLRFDPLTREFARPIPVGNGVRGIAFGEGAIWVTNAVDGTVSRIDPATNSTAATIDVGRKPESIATGAGAVWVVDALDSTLVRIDPKTNKVTHRVQLLSSPSAVAVGDAVWVASETGNSLTSIDPSTIQVRATIPVAGGPSGVAVSGNDVWVTVPRAGTLVHVSGSTGTIAQTQRIRGTPDSVVSVRTAIWLTVQSTP
jgi:YVTN family beta-propeller protein